MHHDTIFQICNLLTFICCGNLNSLKGLEQAGILMPVSIDGLNNFKHVTKNAVT
jgi:hypothetical protein